MVVRDLRWWAVDPRRDPSGVTLAPEGGAHQSVITPSIGLEQPRCIAWEPAFGQDLEWTLLAALSLIGRPGGASAYFRLRTRPIDQALAGLPATPPSGSNGDGRCFPAATYCARHSHADCDSRRQGAIIPELVERLRSSKRTGWL